MSGWLTLSFEQFLQNKDYQFIGVETVGKRCVFILGRMRFDSVHYSDRNQGCYREVASKLKDNKVPRMAMKTGRGN